MFENFEAVSRVVVVIAAACAIAALFIALRFDPKKHRKQKHGNGPNLLPLVAVVMLGLSACDTAADPENVGWQSTVRMGCSPLSYENEVWYFPCTGSDFGNRLSAFIAENNVRVLAISGNGTDAYGDDMGYFVVVEPREVVLREPHKETAFDGSVVIVVPDDEQADCFTFYRDRDQDNMIDSRGRGCYFLDLARMEEEEDFPQAGRPSMTGLMREFGISQ